MAVGKIIDKLFSPTKVTTKSSSEPWKVQAPYVEQGFQQASDAYTAAVNAGPYAGPTSAEIGQGTTQAVNAGQNYAINQGANIAAQVGQQGANLSGVTGAQAAANAQQGFNQGTTANDVMADASTFMNNPMVSAQIDAVGADIRRNLDTNASHMLGAANQYESVASGTAAGAQMGVLHRDARNQLLNASLGIRNNAFNQGISTSLAARNMTQQGQLGFNQQLAGLYGQSTQGALAGTQAATGQYTSAFDLGAGYTNLQQQGLNYDQAGHYQAAMFPLQAAQGYQTAMGGNWGSSTTTQQPGQSIAQTVAGIGLGALSLYKG